MNVQPTSVMNEERKQMCGGNQEVKKESVRGGKLMRQVPFNITLSSVGLAPP